MPNPCFQCHEGTLMSIGHNTRQCNACSTRYTTVDSQNTPNTLIDRAKNTREPKGLTRRLRLLSGLSRHVDTGVSGPGMSHLLIRLASNVIEEYGDNDAMWRVVEPHIEDIDYEHKYSPEHRMNLLTYSAGLIASISHARGLYPNHVYRYAGYFVAACIDWAATIEYQEETE